MLKKLVLSTIATSIIIGGPAIANSKEVISMVNQYVTQNPTIYSKIIADFEKENPNVSIKLSYSTQSAYANKLRNAFLSGTPYDLFAVEPDGGARGIANFLDSQQILDLTPYYQKYGWNKSFYPAIVKQSTINGKQYMFPMSTNNVSVFYNKDLLKKYGNKVPYTYADFKKICDQAVKDKLYCFTPAVKSDNFARDLFYSIAGQIDKNIVHQADIGKLKFTDQRFVKAFSLLKKMVDDGIISKNANSFSPDVIEPVFFSSKAVFYMSGTWFTKSLAINAPKSTHFGVMQLPKLFTGANQVSPGGIGMNYVVYKNTKHKDTVIKFLNFMSQKKYQILIPREAKTAFGVLPAANNNSTINDPLMRKFLQFQTKTVVRALLNPDLNEALTGAVQGVIDGSLSPKDAAEEVADSQ